MKITLGKDEIKEIILSHYKKLGVKVSKTGFVVDGGKHIHFELETDDILQDCRRRESKQYSQHTEECGLGSLHPQEH